MPARVVERNNRKLREAISEITRRHGDLPERERLKKVHEQIQEIASLQKAYGHSITLIEQVNPNDEKSWKFSCFQYAFDMRVLPPKIESVLSRQSGGPRLDFESTFIEFLIQKRKRCFVEQEESKLGSIVIYFGNWMHAGKVIRDGFIVSKWGWMGHLWRHRLYETPVDYGDDAKFFSVIPSEEEIVTTFLEYARANSNGRGQVRS